MPQLERIPDLSVDGLNNERYGSPEFRITFLIPAPPMLAAKATFQMVLMFPSRPVQYSSSTRQYGYSRILSLLTKTAAIFNPSSMEVARILLRRNFVHIILFVAGVDEVDKVGRLEDSRPVHEASDWIQRSCAPSISLHPYTTHAYLLRSGGLCIAIQRRTYRQKRRRQRASQLDQRPVSP
ncbi:hypothetical protein FPOAC2_03641 [Fusarium poae]|jgi:hypothetical protein|uniref:hypothetical protein n=1 Tax=Fusarium poae TaxID=36050 RepID=UPI001CEA3B21|nr:hypothetical protein FPOAC1_003468 [Fusarium poae]KAG8677450.1 hypothetical protein FPOAC1_003468 [Fusarium poae]